MFVINGTPVSREKKLFNKYIEGILLHFLLNNILYSLRSIAPVEFLYFNYIGGQTPASFYLVPNLAVRYRITSIN